MGSKKLTEVACFVNIKIIIVDSSVVKNLIFSDWVAVLTFNNTETPLLSAWLLGAWLGSSP